MPLLTVDGNFGTATKTAVQKALRYWKYSTPAVTAGECDQSLLNHLLTTPPPPVHQNPQVQDGTIHSITTGGNARVHSTDGGLTWHYVK